MNIFIKFLAFFALIVIASALPEDNYEYQLACWKSNKCTKRIPPAVVNVVGTPPLVYYQTDASVEYPYEFCRNTPSSSRLFTDECRIRAILTKDDVDVFSLKWNHTSPIRSNTSNYINTQLFILASDETDNVEIIVAAYADASFPVLAESHKNITDDSIRARVAGIPVTHRLVGSVSLKTRDLAPNYFVKEENNTYWTYPGYVSGCALTPPFGFPTFGFPFNLDNCDLSQGLRLNKNKVALPTSGSLLLYVYEKRGKVVPYTVGTGAYSLIDYFLVNNNIVPAMFYPQFAYVGDEKSISDANFRSLTELGHLTFNSLIISDTFDTQ